MTDEAQEHREGFVLHRNEKLIALDKNRRMTVGVRRKLDDIKERLDAIDARRTR